MTPLLRVYLLVMVAPAAVLTAAVAPEPSAPSDAVLMVVLIALGAVATNFPVRISRHYKAHAAPAIHLAAVLLFSPAAAVAVIGSSALLGEGVLCLRRNPATGFRRRQPVDIVFNTSQLMLAGGVDRRDPYTFQHSQSVADHSVRTARRLGLPDREVEVIRLAARVHDLGKIAIPDEVLHKAGRLTAAEFELMKKHPETGAEILAKFPAYRHGRELVLAHHERIDGLGYPRGLAGAAIALGARIIAVADSWDAMTSDRPYRKALEAEVALGELLRGRGTQWDASVVDAFAESLPGAIPAVDRPRWTDVRPLLRSLGAAVGVIG